MMKILFFLTLICSSVGMAQAEISSSEKSKYIRTTESLTLEAAFVLQKQATEKAALLGKSISVAILDASGNILLLTRGAGVGPHNTEAARRKAFTALSTQTPTLMLLRNAAKNPDTQNLNSLPELLLLSGGIPVYNRSQIVGSIGIAGGGSPENDHAIAQSVQIPEEVISTRNTNIQ